MKSIMMKELKLILKDKRSFFFLLLMPALFIVMFGSVFGGDGSSSSISVHAIDLDQSEASKAFMAQMGTIMDVKTDDDANLNADIDKIKQGQYTALLVVSKGFEQAIKQGRTADIKMYEDSAAALSNAPISAILQHITSQYREQKLTDTLIGKGDMAEQAKQALASPITIESVPTSSDGFHYIDQVVPGMTVMFVFFIMITMSRRFFDEKKTGMLARIRSTSIKPLQYLLGMWVPFIFTVIAQCLILFTFGHLVYDLSLGDLSALSLIVLGLSIAGTGIGLGLSFLVPGEGAAMVITQLISMGGALVGGLWTPSYMLPDSIQTIGHFTPQYWAQHSLVNIIAHGAHIPDVSGAVLILLLFGAAGLLVAWLRLPGFLRSATN